MECQVCFSELSDEGEGMNVSQSNAAGLGKLLATVCNWIVCNGCGNAVCHACCRYPGSGYCDPCFELYKVDCYPTEGGSNICQDVI